MPYFDYAATTPCDARVLETIADHARMPLNASSVHQMGQRARRLLTEARERLAGCLGVTDPAWIVFTSGATEAVNLALRGYQETLGRRMRVLSSPIEHACVTDTLAALAEHGRADVERLAVVPSGRLLMPETLRDPIDLLCIMHANNETGVIQDVTTARDFARDNGIVWLCDASQSLGKIPLDLGVLGADWTVVSSHKVYGPTGVGCLIGPAVKRLESQLTGGPQEDERRAGTQAVALILGFVRAVELAIADMESRRAHLDHLEHVFFDRLDQAGVVWRRNGEAPFLPGFFNVTFDNAAEAMDAVIALDQMGFQVSPGSACSTGVVSISPVLEAMYPGDCVRAAGGVRVTFGKDTAEREVFALADAIIKLWKKG